MKSKYKFGVAINCIDGRVQTPVSDWVKLNGPVEQVDMITEPGVDRILASGERDGVKRVFERVKISVKAHKPLILAVVGHFDCAANVAEFEEHKNQIEESARLISSWGFGLRVVGLYVNEWKSVDLICDSDAEFTEMRSFL